MEAHDWHQLCRLSGLFGAGARGADPSCPEGGSRPVAGGRMAAVERRSRAAASKRGSLRETDALRVVKRGAGDRAGSVANLPLPRLLPAAAGSRTEEPLQCFESLQRLQPTGECVQRGGRDWVFTRHCVRCIIVTVGCPFAMLCIWGQRSWLGAVGGVCAGDGLYCWPAASVHERRRRLLDADGLVEGRCAPSHGGVVLDGAAAAAAVHVAHAVASGGGGAHAGGALAGAGGAALDVL
mmetsp:Transcript_27057/g.48211  ORF Transcript_27057/g.48211 Transcript_27057/m.48211 type:complete len:238 (-) Transcript_27057:399-1112(-)